MAPTVHKEGPYRFFFWTNEPGRGDNVSRAHIHCERDDNIAKFWLENNGKPEVTFVPHESSGFSQKEIKQLKKIIEENVYFFIRKWYVTFQMDFPEYLDIWMKENNPLFVKWLKNHPER